MAQIACLGLLLLVCVHIGSGMPTPDEERFYDKDVQYYRELAELLASISMPSNNPCRNCYQAYSNPMPKRNSELINSLLSLPKAMNDAGK